MKATVVCHKDYQIGTLDRRLFGGMLEHLGRAVYSGVYEPDHPTAASDGLRTDVIELVKELGVTVVRYPGGNYSSGYKWEDGVGPLEQRPSRLDLTWHSREPNRFGMNEFLGWCTRIDAEPMVAFNLGTRGVSEARELLEYLNLPSGSQWSELRRSHGFADPWSVKLWCLGNELDGSWSVGQKTAEEYARLADQTAKAVHLYDEDLELIVCGSTGHMMPTYPDWDATVLRNTYDSVNFISAHMYFNQKDMPLRDFLSMNAALERYIDTIAASIRFAKAQKRSKKDLYISLDEWNVWSRAHTKRSREWPLAPDMLNEIYEFGDALQAACILNSIIRRADVVKIACIAQLINVLAPIRTEPGGAAWRQTTFFPFQFASRYARGWSLRLAVKCPTYDTEHGDQIPYLDISAAHDPDGGQLTFFMVNRHPSERIDVDISVYGLKVRGTPVVHKLASGDLRVVNSASSSPVAPTEGEPPGLARGRLRVAVMPFSYCAVALMAD